MSLIWKLLRRHISVAQFIGFFFANLFGMIIVLLGYQFYRDVEPLFTADDSFMKSDYIIVEKKVGMGTTISGQSNDFSATELQALECSGFSKRIGVFVSADYQASAHMGIDGTSILNSEIFFESIPDVFVDAPAGTWKYDREAAIVPLILPRSYLAMYNFGLAQARSLPKISDGLVGVIDIDIFVQGNGKKGSFKGKVIGFSNRISGILVPQTFMDWSNSFFGSGKRANPTRLILDVDNSKTEQMTKYFDKKGYEVEDDKLNAEKTTYFLRLMSSMVMLVGLVISLLSFYILMLSIYLLVQKNSSKLENLLLIGYSPQAVARPYQLLTIGLNFGVLVIAIVVLAVVRNYYMGVVEILFPDVEVGTLVPAVVLGVGLFLFVSVFNILAIRHKIVKIWKRKV